MKRTGLSSIPILLVVLVIAVPLSARGAATPFSGRQAGGWTIEPSPNAPSGGNSFLSEVTCQAEDDCWAVGNYWTGTHQQPLILRWEGEAWRIVASPSTDPGVHHFLSAVECPSATECWAGGSAGDQSLFLRWEDEEQGAGAGTWEIAPGLGFPGAVSDMTCTSSTDCWAVGRTREGDAVATLAARWDGASWRRVPSPNLERPHINPDIPPINALNAVTCTGHASCWAVGISLNNGTISEAVMMRWDGMAWTLASPPALGPPLGSSLSGVTCTRADDCWAVGRYDAPVTGALIMRWDGTVWRVVVPSRSNGVVSEFLSDVTCASPSECSTVGFVFDRNVGYRTLVMQWDGESWQQVSSPQREGRVDGKLAGVFCGERTSCWAVGTDTRSSLPYSIQTLVLRRDR